MATIKLDEELCPIHPEDPKYATMLANLQGNILKSHGRDYAVHLFLTFKDAPDAIKEWIFAFTSRYVTSALRQHYETKEFKINKISGRVFAGFYLTAAGYQKLGFTDDELAKFKEENPAIGVNDGGEDEDSPANIDISFKAGMAAAEEELKDLPEKSWEEHFQNRQIHALILLADADPKRLEDVAERVQKSLEEMQIASKVSRQNGEVLRDKSEPRQPIEHFGYRDGISQPVFYQDDVEEERKDGYRLWDSFAPLQLVLIRDPLIDEVDCFGSYLVYRKLEQNVKGFKEEEARLAGKDCLSLDENERERAGALVIGRFRNGIPVALSENGNLDDKKIPKNLNNFHFIDPETGATAGNKCPYHAHIRRVNPRGESGSLEDEVKHRIVRRGITYDERQTKEGDPERDVGLLFMCFQSSIPEQFGFIQVKWANTTTFFAHQEVGVDPVIGQFRSLAEFEIQKWHAEWGGDTEPKPFKFRSFIKLKGGEFFFAPSIPFLRSLGKKHENQIQPDVSG